MADSIGKKLKGFFMSKEKKDKADNSSAGENAGFDVLNDAQAPEPDENRGALDGLDTPDGETLTEAPAASEEISEDTEEIKPEPEAKEEVQAEKAHERVSRIAAEKNTKGYGL